MPDSILRDCMIQCTAISGRATHPDSSCSINKAVLASAVATAVAAMCIVTHIECNISPAADDGRRSLSTALPTNARQLWRFILSAVSGPPMYRSQEATVCMTSCPHDVHTRPFHVQIASLTQCTPEPLLPLTAGNCD